VARVLRTDRLRLGYFSGSVVSRVARDGGGYARQGLEVTEHPVASSVEQIQALLDGDLDLVLTSPDNVATYRFNAGNPLGRRADVRIVRPVDHGLGLSLLATPEVTGLEALRGGSVAVDVPASGFAFALYAVMESAGLRPERDYRVVALGSTPRRAAALRAGECAGTLLNAGHDVDAEAVGCRRLARVVDVVGPYLGAVLAARGDWLDRSEAVVGRFLKAWSEATARVLDAAAGPPERGLPDATLATLCSPREGVILDPRVDLSALRTVVDLRDRFGGFERGIDVAAVRDGGLGLLDERFTAATIVQSD
jgi:ABC-type nitrate/sulfonate/bicarbonate transport system substrate-binding protein